MATYRLKSLDGRTAQGYLAALGTLVVLGDGALLSFDGAAAVFDVTADLDEVVADAGRRLVHAFRRSPWRRDAPYCPPTTTPGVALWESIVREDWGKDQEPWSWLRLADGSRTRFDKQKWKVASSPLNLLSGGSQSSGGPIAGAIRRLEEEVCGSIDELLRVFLDGGVFVAVGGKSLFRFTPNSAAGKAEMGREEWVLRSPLLEALCMLGVLCLPVRSLRQESGPPPAAADADAEGEDGASATEKLIGKLVWPLWEMPLHLDAVCALIREPEATGRDHQRWGVREIGTAHRVNVNKYGRLTSPFA